MRTKHLIRELKQMGFTKSEAFRLIKMFKNFNYKFSNSRIYYSLYNRAHLLKKKNAFYTPTKLVINQMKSLINSLESVNDAFNSFAYFALSLFDTGELAFLFSTGND